MSKLILKYQNGGVRTYTGSFNLAFALARKNGDKTFRWRGGEYGTQLKDEQETPRRISMSNAQMPGLTLTNEVRYIAP